MATSPSESVISRHRSATAHVRPYERQKRLRTEGLPQERTFPVAPLELRRWNLVMRRYENDRPDRRLRRHETVMQIESRHTPQVHIDHHARRRVGDASLEKFFRGAEGRERNVVRVKHASEREPNRCVVIDYADPAVIGEVRRVWQYSLYRGQVELLVGYQWVHLLVTATL